MKQNPQTKPAKEILSQFVGWAKVLKRPINDCVLEALELYQTADNKEIAEAGIMGFKKFKNFQFEIDLLKWTEFKRFALETNNHERDVALTIAMSYFNEKYNQMLSEVF